jgi:hypothetical protein
MHARASDGSDICDISVALWHCSACQQQKELEQGECPRHLDCVAMEQVCLHRVILGHSSGSVLHLPE